MIKQLAYLAFEVADFDTWTSFCGDVLGAMPAAPRERGCSFRIDGQAHRLFVEEGAADDLSAVGFEVEDAAALDAAVSRLAAEGIDVVMGTPQEANHRGAEGLARFTFPGGAQIELCHGISQADTPFDSAHICSEFVAGELGLGHCVLRVGDLEEGKRFFCDVMGFGYSDRIRCDLGGFEVDIVFLHTNARHHSIALGCGLPKRIHHFMLQVASIDDLGLAYDRAVDHGVRITQTIGRHPNDRMITFYAHTPSGFEFEIGWGGMQVDDPAWKSKTHDRISEWGHRRPPYRRPKK